MLHLKDYLWYVEVLKSHDYVTYIITNMYSISGANLAFLKT